MSPLGSRAGGHCPAPRVPPSERAGRGAGAHLAHVRVHRRPLAAHGAVGDVAGGGQRQEAEQAAGEAGRGHGAGWGPTATARRARRSALYARPPRARAAVWSRRPLGSGPARPSFAGSAGGVSVSAHVRRATEPAARPGPRGDREHGAGVRPNQGLAGWARHSGRGGQAPTSAPPGQRPLRPPQRASPTPAAPAALSSGRRSLPEPAVPGAHSPPHCPPHAHVPRLEPASGTTSLFLQLLPQSLSSSCEGGTTHRGTGNTWGSVTWK